MRETTPFIVQLKVSLAEVESAIGVIDQAQADLTKRHQELDTRRNNLRALIREYA